MSKVVLWPGFGWIGVGVVGLFAAVIAAVIILFGLYLLFELFSYIHDKSMTEENLFKKVRKLNENMGKLSIKESLKLFSQIEDILHDLRYPHICEDPQAAIGHELYIDETFSEKWNECYNYLVFDVELSKKTYRDFDLAKITEITQRVCTLLAE